MKNVLVIAYYFPPSGGAGVQRTLKHVQYLRDFGWNPIVLTVANGDFPARDESLLNKIPSGIHVERTRIYEPYDLYRKLTGKAAGAPVDVENVNRENVNKDSSSPPTSSNNHAGKQGLKTRLAQHLAQLTQHLAQRFAEFIRATIFIPDARVGWLLTAVDAGERLIREHSIEAIYSSSPPYTPALIARALKRKTGLRWVVGMRDPWTGFLSTPKRWWLPALIDRALERSVFHKADFIECAWEGIIKDIRGKVPDLAPHKLRHIPNGFDSTDYPRDDSQSAEVARNQRFTITYTGTMYGRRNPESLFAAVRLLIEHGKIFPNEIIMRFVGRFGADIKATFEAFPHQESLEIIGYMPHEDSIRALLRSDALLLIVDEAKESEEIVPGKVYEYMGAGKPIIAIAPTDGAIARLLGETRAGSIAPQEDAERLAAIVLNYFNDWKNGTHAFAPDHEKVARYERRNATKELAALLSGNTHEG